MLIPILHLKSEKHAIFQVARGRLEIICDTLYPIALTTQGANRTIHLLKKLDFKKNIIM